MLPQNEAVRLLIITLVTLGVCYYCMLKPRRKIGNHYADLQKRALRNSKGKRL